MVFGKDPRKELAKQIENFDEEPGRRTTTQKKFVEFEVIASQPARRLDLVPSQEEISALEDDSQASASQPTILPSQRSEYTMSPYKYEPRQQPKSTLPFFNTQKASAKATPSLQALDAIPTPSNWRSPLVDDPIES